MTTLYPNKIDVNRFITLDELLEAHPDFYERNSVHYENAHTQKYGDQALATIIIGDVDSIIEEENLPEFLASHTGARHPRMCDLLTALDKHQVQYKIDYDNYSRTAIVIV